MILHHASDRSAKFLTVLAGRTVKISASPKGPRFESRRPQQKCHRSIGQNQIQCQHQVKGQGQSYFPL